MIEKQQIYIQTTTGLYMWACNRPDSDGDGYDIGLGIPCPEHARTVYFCIDAGRIWCDGGAPDWDCHDLCVAS